MSRARRKVLFIGEGVTLAHIGRPIALAEGLDPAAFDVVFACDESHRRWLGARTWPYRPVRSITSEAFMDALASGRPIYDVATLEQYVQDDLDLIADVRPDLVVGDFRLSLSVSARVSRVPYVTISNAYWSPFARQRFPLPEHWTARAFGVPAATAIFRLVRPFVFAHHASPLNRVRRRHGLAPLGSDLRTVYTDADRVAYADVPDMIPTYDLPAHHEYIGPVLWSPQLGLPAWWNNVPEGRPRVYVTMGSSGPSRLLSAVLEVLGGLPYSVLVASAGRATTGAVPDNVFVADYLPGELAAAKAAMVICNGGSPTSHQALAAGVPVLGIASNMDQLLNMQALEDFGAGILVRADRLTAGTLRQAVAALAEQPRHADAARRAATVFARYPAPARFAGVVDRALGEAVAASGKF